MIMIIIHMYVCKVDTCIAIVHMSMYNFKNYLKKILDYFPVNINEFYYIRK